MYVAHEEMCIITILQINKCAVGKQKVKKVYVVS